MRPYLILLLPLLAAGCAGSQAPDADLAAVRAVSMATRPFSWQELRVHPTLRQRACVVSTLVNESGTVVGYCQAGRQCRTMDWRPVEDGCLGPPGQGIAREERNRGSVTQAALGSQSQ
jgi:hypothetical protein